MSDRPTVLVAMAPDIADVVLTEPVAARLAAVADVAAVGPVTDFADPAVRSALADTEVLLTSWGCAAVDAEVLDAAPRLRAVVHAAGSVKGHVHPEVWARGVLVSSAAEVNAWPVAQFTLAVVLLAGKRTFSRAAAYAEGDYRKYTTCLDAGNHDRTIGVIGASRTGRLVLELLAGHGFRLLVADPTLDAAAAAALEPAGRVELVELDDLLVRSDVVTVHAPLLPQTRHLLDERRLGLLRDGAVLVNTSRGALIDAEALQRQCASGRIDAVLDVTDPEPLPPGHRLLTLPNVLVTPHLAGALGTEVSRLGAFAVAEIERLAAGLPLAGAVRPELLSILA